jgi:glycosyltransferase involved in cell wall biosynthesis
MHDRRGSPRRHASLLGSDGHSGRRLNVAFVVHAAVTRDGDLYDSAAPSVRYRACVPARELVEREHSVRVLAFESASRSVTAKRMIDADLVVIGRSFRRDTEQLAREVRARGARVVVDICAEHFTDPELALHQHALVDLADAIVVSSPQLGLMVDRETGRESLIVPDPCEGPEGEPRFAPAGGSELKLLWFGDSTGLEGLARGVSDVVPLVARRAGSLRVVTDCVERATERLAQLSLGSLRVDFATLSKESLWEELERCDVVLLPGPPGQTVEQAGSPNRLVEALRAGRLAVAHPLGCYREFAPYSWIGADLAEGIDWALESPLEARRRIAAGQRFVELGFSAEMVADRWEAVFREAMAAPGSPYRRRSTDKRAAELLGCGAVDRDEPEDDPKAGRAEGSASGALPDCGPSGDERPVRISLHAAGRTSDPGEQGEREVVCDVHQLDALPDAHADELVAVHVIESLWRWEIVETLEEWRRVLRPGGVLVIVSVDLDRACHALVGAVSGSEGRERALRALYGDPRARDPLACRRWGYTAESLGPLLREAGYVNVRLDPAGLDDVDSLDMRIVAEAPRD